MSIDALYHESRSGGKETAARCPPSPPDPPGAVVDTERYLDDLDGWLAIAVDAQVDPATRPLGSERERAADLFQEATLCGVLQQLQPASPALAELVADAALAWRHDDVLREADRLAHAGQPCGPAGPPSWAEAGYWLATVPDAPAPAAVREPLERAGGRVARADIDIARVRESLAVKLGRPPVWESWEQARQRTLPEVTALAGRVLETVAGPALGLLRPDGKTRPGRPCSWVELPRVLSTPPGGAALPPVDPQLLRFVAGELGAGGLLAERVGMHMGPTAPPRAGVVAVRPPQRVYLWLRPLSPARDYRVALRLLGRALYLAGLEDVAGARARCLDPAVAACFGALLEGLPGIDAWRFRLLRRATPAPVAAAIAAQSRLRVGLLAAEVMESAVASPRPAPQRLAVLRGREAEALGFEYPDVPVPWSHGVGEAADELVGWLLAAEVEERLASRFGRDWIRSAAAGAWLRDLWAAAHPTAASLASDLDIVGLGDVDLLRERWADRRRA